MSEQIKDGGPAFPSSYEFDSIDHIPPGEMGVSHRVAVSTPGMTLRDYFAAKAIPMATQWEREFPTGDHAGGSYSGIASRAYFLADAMLAAREVKA